MAISKCPKQCNSCYISPILSALAPVDFAEIHLIDFNCTPPLTTALIEPFSWPSGSQGQAGLLILVLTIDLLKCFEHSNTTVEPVAQASSTGTAGLVA